MVILEKLRVAVIGAGMAGARCARQLADSGCAVMLFDKSRGAGGRLATRRRPAPDGAGTWRLDHGAAGILAGDDDFADQLRDWTGAGLLASWNPRVVQVASDGHYLKADGSDRGCLGQSADRAGPASVGLPGMSAPVRALVGDLPLKAGCRIERIWRGPDDSWWLATGAGADFGPFDAVVLALVPPQAAALLPAGYCDLRLRLQAIPVAPRWTVLHFGGQARGPLEDVDALRFDSGPIELAIRNDRRPGRQDSPGWVLHARVDWSARHVHRPPGWVSAALGAAFRRVGGPAPALSQAHRWLYAHPQPQPGAGYLLRDGLGLCGDWLAGGQVEGAWRSGGLLAKALLHEGEVVQ